MNPRPSARRISYAAIAAAFAISQPLYNEEGERGYRIWKDTVLAVADVLQASSPKFNRKRFLTAAGVLDHPTQPQTHTGKTYPVGVMGLPYLQNVRA